MGRVRWRAEDASSSGMGAVRSAVTDHHAGPLTNLFQNPAVGLNNDGFARIGSANGTPVSERVADASAPSGSGFVSRITYTLDQSGSTALGFLIGDTIRSPTVGGRTYTVGCWLRTSWSTEMFTELRAYTGTSGGSVDPSSNVVCPAGEWVWTWFTKVTDAGSNNVRFIIRSRASSPQAPAGGTFDCGGVMLVEGSNFGDGPLFLYGDDVSAKWLGTPHASQSVGYPHR